MPGAQQQPSMLSSGPVLAAADADGSLLLPPHQPRRAKPFIIGVAGESDKTVDFRVISQQLIAASL